ncbi:hypothetical protein Acsp04_41400 [Actinomadura sp. NBRC 104425]|uniref:hypothetical protein n=1 Tax=Actinomadura sp. NBRC 104425 TaxID=3032204 RepID=UPI00249FEEFB|nr:hypothetical protein [Actinomadura sp. NBRC 104425]GLZ13905.1 hypothetical protein Acsp04_41400 [Actinomadura sp. NBRC 104425]
MREDGDAVVTRSPFERGTAPRSGGTANEEIRPDRLFRAAEGLLRTCGQDAAVAAAVLAVVLLGVLAQVAHGGGRLGVLPLALLVPVAVTFAVSAGLAVRSRLMVVAALGEIRGRTGAPLDPGVPWTPFALGTALDGRVLDEQLRRLLAAAHRCCELAWQAVVWAVATAVLYVCWTLAVAAAGAG